MADAIQPGAVSDADLVRRTSRGDRDAFALLYRRHQATIFRFARFMTGCDAAAEDVVQDVFLALMRDAARYDARRAALSTYLYGVARHLTRRRLLRERRFVALDALDGERAPEPPAADDLDADVLRRGAMRQLRRAILALPSRYREVVVLCDLEEVSYADAAATIGCPIGTIRSRLHRARQMLSHTLSANGTESRNDRVPAAARLRCAV
ncbi:MAG TPA: RNA polymerase sigma factor [Vicinamibacterales bacterium]|nr:RNA polymerase sigma factor [Vicinamibacterales bacterium]